MRKLLIVFALALSALVALSRNTGLLQGERPAPGRILRDHAPNEAAETRRDGDKELTSAFENHESNVIVEGQGVVAKVLKDTTSMEAGISGSFSASARGRRCRSPTTSTSPGESSRSRLAKP